MIRALLVALAVAAVGACARIAVVQGRAMSSSVLLNQYTAAQVLIYHNGPRCKVFVTTPKAVIETAWGRCNWIVQP